MSIESEAIVFDMSDAIAPVWNIAGATLSPDTIVVTFRDGYTRTVSREEVLAAMPSRYADPIAAPEEFSKGRFDPEAGTVVWPNGADIAPEFLRWGPHTGSDCPCGMERESPAEH
jgi:hypothetical protein